MIVSGGENVFPAEVEDCLTRHEAVVEAPRSASTTPSSASGCGRSSWSGTAPAPQRGRAQGAVKQNLARYKVPREIVFLDELPRNATGKVLKRELAEHGETDDGSLHRRARPPTSPCATSSGRTSPCPPSRGSKAVLLVFYPYAFSSVCTGEMSQIRSRLDEFMTFGTEVLAISCDPMHSLRAFADADGLNFPLLSDFWPHGEVTRAYGVFDEAKGARAGRRTSSTRREWWRWSVHNPTSQGRDLDEHLQAASSRWPRPVGPIFNNFACRGWRRLATPATVLPVEPLVTRDASGSTFSCPGRRGQVDQ